MTNSKVGDRVYHFRRGDFFAGTGYGKITWIEGTRAKLLFEHTGKENGVEKRDLIAEDEASTRGLT